MESGMPLFKQREKLKHHYMNQLHPLVLMLVLPSLPRYQLEKYLHL